MTYAVGVDSGGSHTNIRLAAFDGSQKVIPEIDASLASNRTDNEIASAIVQIFAAIQAHVPANPTFVWISAAGYSAPTRDRFVRLLESAATYFGGRIGICNDAVGILLAHDAELVTIVSGTGSVAMARSPSGEVIVTGGDEWVFADTGSAFWIAINAIRAAYQAMDRDQDTALLNGIIEHYRPLHPKTSTADARAIISDIARSLAAMGAATKPAIASFARQVTHQAESGDHLARGIVRKAADDLAAAAAKVYRELADRAHPRLVLPRFLLNGGVGFHSRFYAEALRASLSQFLFDVRDALGQDISLAIQENATTEAVQLAKCLADGIEPPVIDPRYMYSILGPR